LGVAVFVVFDNSVPNFATKMISFAKLTYRRVIYAVYRGGCAFCRGDYWNSLRACASISCHALISLNAFQWAWLLFFGESVKTLSITATSERLMHMTN